MRLDALPLAKSLGSARRRLLIIDYDGTLAPFDSNPARVAMLPESERALVSLLHVPDTTVAIVSGRPFRDISARVPEGVLAVGSHGRESSQWEDGGDPFPADEVKKWAQNLLEGYAVVWQVKPHGFAANLRGLPPAEQAEVVRRVGRGCPVPGVRTLLGRQIVEWVAEDGLHKGDAALRLKDTTNTPNDGILVIGDDTTDEDMFQALPDAFTIHVGDGESAATYRLADPHDVARFLTEVSEALSLALAGRHA